MEYETIIIKFEDNQVNRRDAPKIRGYIAAKFPEYVELHHHSDQGIIYRYPLIQYKIVNNSPILVGIEKGAEILRRIEPEIKNLDIEGDVQQVYCKSIKCRKANFGVANKLIKYRFATPWMALNQNNYKKYVTSSTDQQISLITNILIGNLISMSKGISYNVEERLYAMLEVSPINVNFKNQKMIAFKGKFTCNFWIPDFLGIGKSVSRGFGTVLKEEIV